MSNLQKTSQKSSETVKKLSYESKEFRNNLIAEGRKLNLSARAFLPFMLGFFTYYLGLFNAETMIEKIGISVFVGACYALTSWGESYLAVGVSYFKGMKDEAPVAYWIFVILLGVFVIIPIFHAFSIAQSAGSNGWFLFPIILGLFLLPISSKMMQGHLARRIEDTSEKQTITKSESIAENKELQEVPKTSQEVPYISITHGVSEGRRLAKMTEVEFRKNYGELIPLMEKQLEDLGSINVAFLLNHFDPNNKPDRKTLEKICSKWVDDIRHVETKTIVEDEQGKTVGLEQKAEKGKCLQPKPNVNGVHFSNVKAPTLSRD